MLCQHCHKNEATTHIKTMINGDYAEYRLCPECAQELGYGEMFPDLTADFGGLLGSFFSALPARSGATRCKMCGSTLDSIKKSGKVGCAMCYDTFYSELMPTIRNVHGNTEHLGKNPVKLASAEDKADEPKTADELDNLKTVLKKAIEDENFERAAELRDKIKEREGSR